MRNPLVFAFPLLLCACHAKFKKNAPDLDHVRVQIVNTGGPYVNLGKVAPHDPSPEAHIVAAAINTGQAIREVNVGAEFAQRVDPMPLNDAMTQGMLDTIREGPPFALTTDEQVGHVLQLEVLSYGLNVPYLGAPGQFTFDVRARLYRGDTGDRVYSTSLSCDSGGVGSPDAASVVFSTVNNVKQLRNMSDEQIQQAFDDMAYWCGTYFASRMRKHAG